MPDRNPTTRKHHGKSPGTRRAWGSCTTESPFSDHKNGKTVLYEFYNEARHIQGEHFFMSWGPWDGTITYTQAEVTPDTTAQTPPGILCNSLLVRLSKYGLLVDF